MPRNNGRFSRVYMPVAKRRVVVAEGVAIPDPFIEWMHNTASSDVLPLIAPEYDRTIMGAVQTMQGNRISRKGLRGLIDRICPYLNPQRKALLLERMDSLLAHRKSVLDRREIAELEGMMHRARRWTKKEKRAKKESDARKELKTLLRK